MEVTLDNVTCTLPYNVLFNATLFQEFLMRSVSEECNCSLFESMMATVSPEGPIHLSCSPVPMPHSLLFETLYSLLFSSIIVVSVIGNFTVIWIVLFHERMRTVTNYYLLNLAISDVSISLLNTGFTWKYNMNYDWTMYDFYCYINVFMGVAPICASVFTMTVMSIDRYWAVVHPLRRRPGRRATMCVIVGIWVLSVLCASPMPFVTTLVDHFFYNPSTRVLTRKHTCASEYHHEELFALYSLLFIPTIQYIMPFIVLSYTYWRVGSVLREKESVGDIRHIRVVAAKRKASRMLALVVLMFVLVWLPYQAYLFLFYATSIFPEHLCPYIYINCYLLGMSYSIFNPIIYYFMNKRFRIGFRYAFRWLPCLNVSVSDYSCLLGSDARGQSLTPSYHIHSRTYHTITTPF